MIISTSTGVAADDPSAPGRFVYTPTGRVILDGDTIALLRKRLPNESKETVSDALGISSNTWIKVKRGKPVNASLARRLVERIEK
jgi:hypothetical protein